MPKHVLLARGLLQCDSMLHLERVTPLLQIVKATLWNLNHSRCKCSRAIGLIDRHGRGHISETGPAHELGHITRATRKGSEKVTPIVSDPESE